MRTGARTITDLTLVPAFQAKGLKRRLLELETAQDFTTSSTLTLRE